MIQPVGRARRQAPEPWVYSHHLHVIRLDRLAVRSRRNDNAAQNEHRSNGGIGRSLQALGQVDIEEAALQLHRQVRFAQAHESKPAQTVSHTVPNQQPTHEGSGRDGRS